MTEQEKLARQWAERVKEDKARVQGIPDIQTGLYAAADYILAHVSAPTMADVEWDVREHYLAGATCNADGSERVMLMSRDGRIINAVPEVDRVSTSSPGVLTPNGKRYKLVEVTGPGHPEVLETEEDYRDAPEGTVIGDCYGRLYLKIAHHHWKVVGVAGGTHTPEGYLPVLRWGWGE